MKYFLKPCLFLALPVLLLFSCDQEEIIELDLSGAPAQYVIEGRVTDEAVPFQVRISRTVDVYHSNDFPAVRSAVVTISDDSGQVDTLLETTPGVYETADAIPGVSGRTYTLQVWVEGRYFVAHSTMPALVPFTDLRAIPLPFGGTNTLVMTPVFNDPAGLGNNYQFVQSNNGVRLPNIFVADDRNTDGSQVSTLLIAPEMETKRGDTVLVEMRNIDRATYKYFVALDASNGNGPNASVPANPDNNFEGACLGYFSAYTVQRKSVVVE
ncbi:MAG: DUF4249 domain-containing protein [Saprospiraceae bacterium]|nr:DUF4249 domain-containing protein [Saprospiraceae bacterium]